MWLRVTISAYNDWGLLPLIIWRQTWGLLLVPIYFTVASQGWETTFSFCWPWFSSSASLPDPACWWSHKWDFATHFLVLYKWRPNVARIESHFTLIRRKPSLTKICLKRGEGWALNWKTKLGDNRETKATMKRVPLKFSPQYSLNCGGERERPFLK